MLVEAERLGTLPHRRARALGRTIVIKEVGTTDEGGDRVRKHDRKANAVVDDLLTDAADCAVGDRGEVAAHHFRRATGTLQQKRSDGVAIAAASRPRRPVAIVGGILVA